jgi:hypothetical protein
MTHHASPIEEWLDLVAEAHSPCDRLDLDGRA